MISIDFYNLLIFNYQDFQISSCSLIQFKKTFITLNPLPASVLLNQSFSMEILIKNMVCPRCIEAVTKTFEELEIPIDAIELGKVHLPSPLSSELKSILSKSLKSQGFELLESKNAALISQIKSLIIKQIHHSDQILGENYSTFLSEKLEQEYTSLSRLFAQVEGITIERFITRQKIERVKELLFYNQMNLSQISFDLNYSSVAHLSTQFKKETGMTPSEFKKNRSGERQSLDKI